MTKRDAFLLFLSVGIIIGYTYALDIPQALQIPLRKDPYNFTTTQFNFMYFSTFLLIGPSQIPLGILIDRYPVKKTLLALLICLFLSQTIIAIMFQYIPTGYLPVIMVMRSIFGLAGEGLYTVQCLIMSVFAEGQYQFLAGLALALPFTFDAFNSVTSTAVYDATSNLPLVWFIGSGVCFVSLLLGIWMNKSIIGEQNQERNNALGKQASFLKEIRVLTPKFWVLIGCIFFAEASLGSFNDNLNEFIVSRFGFSYTDAGKLLLIPFIALAIFTTILGLLLKKRPSLRRNSILFSTSIYMFAHLGLLLLPNTKEPQFYHYLTVIIFLFSMSLNFSVYYASITTSIPFLVSPSVLGTAWGCAGTAIGLSQCLIPLLNASIISSSSDLSIAYRNLSIGGFAFAVVPVGFAVWIKYRDFNILDGHYSQFIQSLQKESSSIQGISDDKNGLEQSLITHDSLEDKSTSNEVA